ncbi:MAG: hypothetical protein IJG82_09200 [Atopobiaceae bacterium]|nr:hypothetical protein [Atopobiaceae bacterium]
MLRVYKFPNGRTYQFEEGEQPEGAIIVEMSHGGATTPEGPKGPERGAARKRRAPAKKSQE